MPFDPQRGVGAYFVRRAQAHGLIVRVLGGDVIAFSPPLVISAAEIDVLLERAAHALEDTLRWLRGST
jgi:4-aminobutyrate--pyruvate transaminase